MRDLIMDKAFSNKKSLEEWVSIFKEILDSEDLKEDIVESFIKHLADLEVINVDGNGVWEWLGEVHPNDKTGLVCQIKRVLETMSEKESGFALPYFIGYKDLYKAPLETLGNKDLATNEKRKKNIFSQKKETASDLSNLQIVKKVGKQLQPFLQLEEAVVSRLLGNRVNKQEAQKMFHYMFSKVGKKAEPRKWEQLSRKRHK